MNEFEAFSDIPDPEHLRGPQRAAAESALTSCASVGGVAGVAGERSASPARSRVRTKKIGALTASAVLMAATLASTGVRSELSVKGWLFGVGMPVVVASATFAQACSRRQHSRVLWQLAPLLGAAFVVSALVAHRPTAGNEAHINCVAIVAFWCLSLAGLALAILRHALPHGAGARAVLLALSVGVFAGGFARAFCQHEHVSHVLIAHGGPAVIALVVFTGLRRSLIV